MKKYVIHSIFDTIQGEGSRAGHRSVFVRFSGCNVWTGRPEDRTKGHGSCSMWCDTNFAGGDMLTISDILQRMNAVWPLGPGQRRRWCVLTGGEPSLQFDKLLIDAMHSEGWKVAVETNGSILNLAFADIDFVTLSPKLGVPVRLAMCDELKIVLPGDVPGMPGWQELGDGGMLAVASRFHGAKLYVQPQDPVGLLDVDASYLHGFFPAAQGQWKQNVARCIEFVKANPDWGLSLQTHKILGLP